MQAAFANAVRNTGQTAPQPVQGALAEFIDAGHYGAHVRRMRNRYAKRQALLFGLVREHLSGTIELAPTNSGMHVDTSAPTGYQRMQGLRRKQTVI